MQGAIEARCWWVKRFESECLKALDSAERLDMDVEAGGSSVAPNAAPRTATLTVKLSQPDWLGRGYIEAQTKRTDGSSKTLDGDLVVKELVAIHGETKMLRSTPSPTIHGESFVGIE